MLLVGVRYYAFMDKVQIRTSMKATLWSISLISPVDKMAAISQTTFSNAFPWVKSFVFWFKFHWFVPKGPIDNKWALVQVMAWRRIGDKPLPEPMLIQFTDTYMRH